MKIILNKNKTFSVYRSPFFRSKVKQTNLTNVEIFIRLKISPACCCPAETRSKLDHHQDI